MLCHPGQVVPPLWVFLKLVCQGEVSQSLTLSPQRKEMERALGLQVGSTVISNCDAYASLADSKDTTNKALPWSWKKYLQGKKPASGPLSPGCGVLSVPPPSPLKPVLLSKLVAQQIKPPPSAPGIPQGHQSEFWLLHFQSSSQLTASEHTWHKCLGYCTHKGDPEEALALDRPSSSHCGHVGSEPVD